MASNPHTLRPAPLPEHLVLQYISGKGMVFRGDRYYEPGTCLAVGMYLQKIRLDLGMCEHGCVLNGDQFLNLRGAVADSRMVDTGDGSTCYQVTLLFENTGEGDLRILHEIERERRMGGHCRREKKMLMGLN